MEKLITAAEIAQATQEQFNKTSDYDTDTGLRLSRDDINFTAARMASDEFPLDFDSSMIARSIAVSLFEYDLTGITYSGTVDIVNDVLGTNIKWSD